MTRIVRSPVLLIAGLLCLQCPATAAAEERLPAGLADRSELDAYLDCSAAARTRLLDPAEARNCAMLYLGVKLSFLSEGVDVEAYRAMPARQRAAVNRRAYLAYRAWIAANPGSGAGRERPRGRQ